MYHVRLPRSAVSATAVSHQRGFTLVELAIVLVIIGLIIGGILVGQDMIRIASLRKIGQEVDQMKSTAALFKDRFRQLPGDMPNAFSVWGAACGANNDTATAGCNGNGDGVIVYADGAPNGNAESAKALEHLALAGLLQGSYNGDYNTGFALANTNAVRSNALSGAVWMLADGTPNWASAGGETAASAGPFYSLGVPDPGSSPFTYSLNHPDMQWVDQKFDDGLPQRGAVRGDGGGDCGLATYDLTITYLDCIPHFRLGVQ